MFHNVLASLRGVATHVKSQQIRDGVFIQCVDSGESHLGADEGLEFAWRYFTESFEPCDFVVRQSLDCCVALGLRVTVDGLFFIADAE